MDDFLVRDSNLTDLRLDTDQCENLGEEYDMLFPKLTVK